MEDGSAAREDGRKSARGSIRATVSYDGTAYRGFQRQADGVTVQSVLEKALERLLQEPVRVRAAGRTDAGVHARAQVIDFAHSGRRSAATILKGGNALLPGDIRIVAAEEAPGAFDARRDATSKEYRYFLYLAPVASPFLLSYAWHLPRAVDIGAMRAGLAHLVGTHDFSSFRGQGCTARTPVRELLGAGIEAESVPGLHSVRVEGRGFLRHMVRNIVGTAVEVGAGKIPPERMRELLALRDRRLSGPTAPARGLFLWRVAYGAWRSGPP